MIIYEPKGRAREYCELAVNLYRGCGHFCRYCYVPRLLRMTEEEFHNPKPREDIINKLRIECETRDLKGQSVLLSFTSDPYQPIELQHNLTRQAIKLIHAAGGNVEILTKGGIRAARDYDLYLSGDKFATTMTFMDSQKTEKWEKGTELPDSRIASLKIAKFEGITTWVSLEPIIIPSETYEAISMTHDFVDMYKIGKLNYYKNNIDWHKVVNEIIRLMKYYDKKYYIKEDLAKYI